MAQQAVVLCGRLEFDWSSLAAAEKNFDEYVEEYPALYKIGYQHVDAVALSEADRLNILRLVHQTRGADVADPRDRLFCLKGLMGSEDMDVEVDYSKGVQTVYRDWARNRIQRRTRRLDVLSACQDSANTSHQAPGTWLSSWVPDLRNVRKMDVHMFELSNGMQRDVDGMIEYRADPITRWRLFEANHDPNLLVIRGVKVDTIAKTISFGIEVMSPPIVVPTDLHEKYSLCEQLVFSHFGETFQPETHHATAFMDVLFLGQVSFVKSVLPIRTRLQHWRTHDPPPEGFRPELSDEARKKAYYTVLSTYSLL
jgi:hypothetical protein